MATLATDAGRVEEVMRMIQQNLKVGILVPRLLLLLPIQNDLS